MLSSTAPAHPTRDVNVWLGRTLARGMLELGIGPTEVSRALRVRRQLVQGMREGARPIHVRHLMALPEPLRDFMLSEIAKRLGRLLGDRIEPDPRSLRGVARELAGLLTELLELAAKDRITSAMAARPLRRIGERLMRLGGGLVDLAERVREEHVLTLVDDDEDDDGA